MSVILKRAHHIKFGGWKTIIAFPDRISREWDNYLDVFSNPFKSPFKSPFNYLDVLCCIGRLCRAESILFQRPGCKTRQTLNVRVAVVASTSFFDPSFVSTGVLCPLVALRQPPVHVLTAVVF